METGINITPPMFLAVARRLRQLHWRVVDLSRFVFHRNRTRMEHCLIARRTWRNSMCHMRRFTAVLIYHNNVIYCFLQAHEFVFLGAFLLDYRFHTFLHLLGNLFEEAMVVPIRICVREDRRERLYMSMVYYRTPGDLCNEFRRFQARWRLHTGSGDSFSFSVTNFRGDMYI